MGKSAVYCNLHVKNFNWTISTYKTYLEKLFVNSMNLKNTKYNRGSILYSNLDWTSCEITTFLTKNIKSYLMNQPCDEWSWCIDSGNELRYHLKPIVDFDGPNPLMQSLVHVWLVAVVEQQSQEPKSILQRASFWQWYRLDETFQCRNSVGRDGRRVQRRLRFRLSWLLLPVEETCLKIHDCPSMPRLVPVAVVLRRGRVVHQDGLDGVLHDAVEVFLPLSELEVTSGQKLSRIVFLFLQRIVSFSFFR